MSSVSIVIFIEAASHVTAASDVRRRGSRASPRLTVSDADEQERSCSVMPPTAPMRDKRYPLRSRWRPSARRVAEPDRVAETLEAGGVRGLGEDLAGDVAVRRQPHSAAARALDRDADAGRDPHDLDLGRGKVVAVLVLDALAARGVDHR